MLLEAWTLNTSHISLALIHWSSNALWEIYIHIHTQLCCDVFFFFLFKLKQMCLTMLWHQCLTNIWYLISHFPPSLKFLYIKIFSSHFFKTEKKKDKGELIADILLEEEKKKKQNTHTHTLSTYRLRGKSEYSVRRRE